MDTFTEQLNTADFDQSIEAFHGMEIFAVNSQILLLQFYQRYRCLVKIIHSQNQ